MEGRRENKGRQSYTQRSRVMVQRLMWLEYLRSIKSQRIVKDFSASVGCLANACASVTASLGQAGKFDLKEEALG